MPKLFIIGFAPLTCAADIQPSWAVRLSAHHYADLRADEQLLRRPEAQIRTVPDSARRV